MALDGLDREHVYELFERAVKDYICEFWGWWLGAWQCHLDQSLLSWIML
jgi:hypothetical protein